MVDPEIQFQHFRKLSLLEIFIPFDVFYVKDAHGHVSVFSRVWTNCGNIQSRFRLLV